MSSFLFSKTALWVMKMKPSHPIKINQIHDIINQRQDEPLDHGNEYNHLLNDNQHE